jgi:predicted enzyme related to lactoylglutathione lyase
MSKSSKTLGVAFTLYPVRDMARARRFYEGGLGLKLSKRWKWAWLEYHLPGGCFALVKQDGKAKRGPSGQVAFEVTDVDAAVARLRKRGAKLVGGPHDSTVCRMADLRDPDGNHFMLHRKH